VQNLQKTLPTQSMGLAADITHPENLNNAKEKIIEEFGKIDILVNNAAINDMVESPISMFESSKFEIIRLNFQESYRH